MVVSSAHFLKHWPPRQNAPNTPLGAGKGPKRREFKRAASPLDSVWTEDFSWPTLGLFLIFSKHLSHVVFIALSLCEPHLALRLFVVPNARNC